MTLPVLDADTLSVAPSLTPGDAKYLPNPERGGTALCLSGGGYRATLFHLGAIRRLNELGVLPQVDEITSVSGGSIMAAQLASAIHAAGEMPKDGFTTPEFDRLVAEPVRAFTARNIRTGAILSRALPWNWVDDDAGVEALEDAYAQHLTSLSLRDLPAWPLFTFCATDMAFGTNWIFRRDQVGDHQAGYMSPPAEMRVARAVAASSCFPPVFNPLRIGVDPASLTEGDYAGSDRADCIRGLRLTDGGNYDNLGLEPVWKNRSTVLVSDGGGIFEYGGDRGLAWRVERYTSIIDNQARALRKRWLLTGYLNNQFAGTYWGIASAPASYAADRPGFAEEFAKKSIAKIRTDLDAFTPGEQGVLENHGYALADVAIRIHASHMIRQEAPFAAPAPAYDWHNMEMAEEMVRESSRRSWIGRN